MKLSWSNYYVYFFWVDAFWQSTICGSVLVFTYHNVRNRWGGMVGTCDELPVGKRTSPQKASIEYKVFLEENGATVDPGNVKAGAAQSK